MTRKSSKKVLPKKKKSPSKKDWTVEDFVRSVHSVMQKQEKKYPWIKRLHQRLASPTKIIGLTGNFGTGKSTVARLFSEAGFPCLDADQAGHTLMAPGSAVWKEIVKRWGPKILNADQTIDRQILSRSVFADTEDRKALEAILHPRIRETLLRKVKEYEETGARAVVLEIPLLFEVRWHATERLDAIVVVTCDPQIRKERIRKKWNLSDSEIEAREKAQWPIEEKIKLADFVIDNRGNLEATREQVEKVLREIVK